MPHNKNGTYWYPGLRRLMPVPWSYTIPNFSWLDPEAYKRMKVKAPIKKQVIINKVKPEPIILEKPTKQNTLF